MFFLSPIDFWFSNCCLLYLLPEASKTHTSLCPLLAAVVVCCILRQKVKHFGLPWRVWTVAKFWLEMQCETCRGVTRLSTSGGQERNASSFYSFSYYFLLFLLIFHHFLSQFGSLGCLLSVRRGLNVVNTKFFEMYGNGEVMV